MKNLSATARPLHDLLKKKSEWKWGREQEDSFQAIRNQLVSAPVMAHFDAREMKVITDPSPTGLGAFLVQGKEEKPVMCISRSLTDHERNYSQIEREGLGVLWALQRLKQFLYGRKFKIVTDNKPLAQEILPLKQLPALASYRIQRWALKLSEYQYQVEVRRSCQIPVADWLSRLPCSNGKEGIQESEDEFSVCAVQQVETLPPVTASQIETETRRDPTLSRVVEFIRRGMARACRRNSPGVQGQASRTNRRKWMYPVVYESDSSGEVEGSSPKRTPPRTPRHSEDETAESSPCLVAKPGSRIDLKVRACKNCWEKRPNPVKTSLHPWEFARGPWQRIHADFTGPVKGSYYLVVVDSFSKWLEVEKM